MGAYGIELSAEIARKRSEIELLHGKQAADRLFEHAINRGKVTLFSVHELFRLYHARVMTGEKWWKITGDDEPEAPVGILPMSNDKPKPYKFAKVNVVDEEE